MKGFFAWVALAASSAHALDNGVGRIPVMGWTSWEPGAREPGATVQAVLQCMGGLHACMHNPCINSVQGRCRPAESQVVWPEHNRAVCECSLR
jgi:hypothetical protein